MNSFDMKNSIGYAILDVARHMGKHLDDMNGEVTMAQGLVLYYIDQNGNDCTIQQDLAEILNINKSGLLRTVDILEKKGFLKRLPVENDRRKNRLAITETGSVLVEKFVNEMRLKNEDLKTGFTQNEIEAFFKILATLKAKLGSMEPQ